MNISETWSDCLDVVKSEVTPIAFSTWFSPIVPLEAQQDRVILSVDNELSKDMLEKRFIEIVKSALYTVTKNIYEVEIVVGGQKNNTPKKEKVQSQRSAQLIPFAANPKYTFDNFVVGNSNKFAHAASLAVAESPATAYNPLFLYGGAGLGKTHLMHAIANYAKENNPDLNVVYVSSEKFTNDMINAIRDDQRNEFREKYRSVDLLLVDDVQFIGGKESTQEEFFHTFNALHDANKQIVLTSDRSPKEISTLSERLRTRFYWGLISDIQAPDYETRIAILKKKAQDENIFIPSEILSFIADRIKSNIRELEGALTRIISFAKITDREISIDLANEALKQFMPDQNVVKITAKRVMDSAAKYYNLMVADLTGKVKTKNIATARQVAMYLCRELTDLSYPAIGQEFGGKDHTTVMYAADKISKDIEKDETLKKEILFLIKDIKTL